MSTGVSDQNPSGSSAGGSGGMPSMQMLAAMGPPYPPQVAALGGVPDNSVDTPITAVFLVLFILGAVANMTIYQLNNKRGHKFIMSGLLFGFCMARITTCVMRIVWANRTQNVSVAIAAQVFTSAGVVILYIVNAIFAQRIVRAAHRNAGWSPLFNAAFAFIYFLVIVSLIMLIVLTVYSFFTLDPYLRQLAVHFQWYGGCAFLFVAFVPIPVVIGGLVIPRSTRVDKFGSGRHRSKYFIVLLAAVLLTLAASFKTGTNFLPPRPRNDPAWYQSKACFYCFNFLIEIIVIYLYVLVRVDRRFHVPNGAKGPGAYSEHRLHEKIDSLAENGEAGAKAAPESSTAAATAPAEGRTETRIMSEEEVFDDAPEDLGDNDGAAARPLSSGKKPNVVSPEVV